MVLVRLLLLLTLAALALAEPAAAGGAAVRSIELLRAPGAGVRVATGRFELAGAHWRGSGRVELRARAADGVWSQWQELPIATADGPDLGSREAGGNDATTLGGPVWVGTSTGLEVRTRGKVTRMRIWTVRSPEVRIPLRRVAAVTAPPIVSRATWGADESIRRGDPSYAAELRYAVVHHTAGKNTYTRGEAAAIVRGIQLYHVQANGWNDIGYNFLVDRFGTVYEGRYGGADANVIGAHAQGFNTGSTGVAVIGTFGAAGPPVAAQTSLERLLAWRLDLAHVDPTAMLTVASGGSSRYAAGVPVLLQAVSGHRDTGYTACPGDALHARLGTIATVTQSIGLPKLYEPRATQSGQAVLFEGRLSAALQWNVTVRDAQGNPVATGSGSGTDISWVWDASAAPAGDYGWLIEAGAGSATVTAASGVVTTGTTPPPLELRDARLEPDVVTPNADGSDDTAMLSYTLTAPATADVTVVDAAGLVALEVEPARWRRAGEHTVAIDPSPLPDGRYLVRVQARSATGEVADADVPLVVSRTIAAVAISPTVFSPNGDGRADTVRIAFTLTKPADVTLTLTRDGRPVASIDAGRLLRGRRSLRWDGSKADGVVRDGSLVALIEAADGIATARAEVSFAADTTPPRLRLVSVTPLRLSVSEPAVVRVHVNGAVRRLSVERQGIITIPRTAALRALRVDAWDAAGNAARTLRATGNP